MDGTTRDAFSAPASHDAFPAGFGGAAFTKETDPETGLPLWSATRLAALQCKLNQRLGPEYLSQRPGPGGGPKLTYIEGWKVVDLANEVFGFNGWSTSVTSLDIDYVGPALTQLDVHPESGRCNCGVSAIVRITLRDGTYHEDVGYGHTEGARGKHAALEKVRAGHLSSAKRRPSRIRSSVGSKPLAGCLGKSFTDTVTVCMTGSTRAKFSECPCLRYAHPLTQIPLDASDLHRHTDTPSAAPGTSSDSKKRAGDDLERERAAAEAKQARLKLAAAARAKLAERQGADKSAPAQPRPGVHLNAPDSPKTPVESNAKAPSVASDAAPPTSTRPAPRPRIHVKAEPPPVPASASSASDTHWNQELDDAEAASMALELELEEDLLLRQSQLAQELDDDVLETDADTV